MMDDVRFEMRAIAISSDLKQDGRNRTSGSPAEYGAEGDEPGRRWIPVGVVGEVGRSMQPLHVSAWNSR